MRIHPVVPAPLLALLLAAPAFADHHTAHDKAMPHGKSAENGMAMLTPDRLDWQPGPPSLPKGVQVAMLQGDPFQPGPFVIRLKMPAGYVIPPHRHSKAENVTVISGTLFLGMGDTVDRRKAQKLPAGGFHSIDAEVHHYAFAPGGAVVQLHGEGPFDITYLNPADNPEPHARQSRAP
jgi:quercetin dioxygenase-like cupin family protein